MRKKLLLILIFLFLCFFGTNDHLNASPKAPTGYLIISNNLCIVVKSPARQLSAIPGQAPLLIILQDKTTTVTIQGGYLAIAAPLNKLEETIRKYHLRNLTVLE